MGIRSSAQAHIDIPLYVAYQCSKCGKVNCKVHVVSDDSDVAANDIIIWQGKKEDFNDNLNEKNIIKTNKKIKKIFAEQKKGLYRSAEFDCRCENCNNKEPWSKMRYRNWDTIFQLLLFITVILLITSTVAAVGTLCAAVLCLIIKFSHRHYNEKKIRKLSTLSLPCFSMTPRESADLFMNKVFETRAARGSVDSDTSSPNNTELSEKPK